MNRKTKKLLLILIILFLVCMVATIFCFLPSKENSRGDNSTIDSFENQEVIFDIIPPWEEEGAKQPEDYTRNEYEKLTPYEKDIFQNSFENNEDLNKWAERENVTIELFPWNTGGKSPEKYTLQEYLALTESQKNGFKLYFKFPEKFEEWLKNAEENEKLPPWETGGKQPAEYTLEEYYSLDDSLQLIFQGSFNDIESYDKWFEQAVEKCESTMPWENGNKKPTDYSLDEYKALNSIQQIMFKNWFMSIEEYESWLAHAEAISTEKMPWETGGKTPDQYTLAEYKSLSIEQQYIFQKWFISESEFNAWLSQKQENSMSAENNPWETGGKLPSEYTLSEFNDLTDNQQVAFQQWFENPSDFDEWLADAQNSNAILNPNPWEIDGKLPIEYTYDEFNSLTGAQQIAFQQWFENPGDFDEWLVNAQDSSESSVDINPWENGGKFPNEYTLDEFNSLTGSQQIAFQQWFENPGDFDAWLSNAQKTQVDNADLPWENGGKKPEEYTWAEFEALTGPQQIAFQQAFASYDDFETWMYAALGE